MVDTKAMEMERRADLRRDGAEASEEPGDAPAAAGGHGVFHELGQLGRLHQQRHHRRGVAVEGVDEGRDGGGADGRPVVGAVDGDAQLARRPLRRLQRPAAGAQQPHRGAADAPGHGQRRLQPQRQQGSSISATARSRAIVKEAGPTRAMEALLGTAEKTLLGASTDASDWSDWSA